MTHSKEKSKISKYSDRQPKEGNLQNLKVSASSKIEEHEAIVEQPLGSNATIKSKRKKLAKHKNLANDSENQTPENNPSSIPLEPIPGVPLGLEFLVEIDKLRIKNQTSRDRVDLMEAYKDDKCYDILTSDDKRLYFAAELLSERFVACGDAERPFELVVLDYTGRGVLDIKKDSSCQLYCTSCCFFCCGCLGTIGGKVDVYLPDKTYMGTVAHSYGFYRPIFNVIDSKGNVILKIRGLVRCGDCCIHQRCHKVENIFRIVSTKGGEIGAIRRNPVDTLIALDGAVITAEQTANLKVQQDCLIRFTRDLEVSTKALLLAATFLINWMYYGEESTKDEEDYYDDNYDAPRRKSKRRSEAKTRGSRPKVGNW